MVTYRLIGKGTTDGNGVAHMTKATSDGGSTWTDTTGYTGVGAGEIDVVASTDNPMSSSSCQSETYPIIDGLFFDAATSQDNSKWQNYGCTANYSSDGTNLKYGTDYRYLAIFSLEESIAIEYDINIPSTVTSNPNLYIKGLTPYFSAEWFARDTWHHIKITCQNGRYDLYSDGTFKVGGEYNTANKIFQFRTVEGAELTFKNFVIYPI